MYFTTLFVRRKISMLMKKLGSNHFKNSYIRIDSTKSLKTRKVPKDFLYAYYDLQNHLNAQISNPSQIFKLFTFQIEPIHHSNRDTTKNKGRNSRTKCRERKRRAMTIEVVVVVPVNTANRNGGGAQGFGLG
ncbi:hypothetical protein CFP56_024662 [Quercus suber]|uniref:Uncharacterized protein n=1 Tax=Quercus suber TaxID=58331 RepID=A0AAW0K7S8_QUESU